MRLRISKKQANMGRNECDPEEELALFHNEDQSPRVMSIISCDCCSFTRLNASAKAIEELSRVSFPRPAPLLSLPVRRCG